MAVYFASDTHLRLDKPQRGLRLAEWVGTLGPDDTLYLVGDVCDFWFASRQIRAGASACAGLSSLSAFTGRGGALVILPGNHDLWLGPFYEEALGARVTGEPLRVDAHGVRLHLVHGHRAGGRQFWKSGMESRAFLSTFAGLPAAVANRLDRGLDQSNDRSRTADEDRLLGHFRTYAAGVPADTDIALFGHVHRPVDEPGPPRLIVLGGWHRGVSYLKVDEHGAAFTVKPIEECAGSH